jgi:hypothetical protein
VSALFGQSVTSMRSEWGGVRTPRLRVVGALASPLMLGLAVIALTGASAGSAYAVVPTTTIAIAHTVTSHAVAGVSTGSTAKSAAAHVEMPVPGGASLGVSAYNAVSCLTSTKCVAVGALASGQGQIGTTTNAGTTYSPISLPASTPALRAVSCVANAECAAVGVGDIDLGRRRHVVDVTPVERRWSQPDGS